jgi:hypothetical protein
MFQVVKRATLLYPSGATNHLFVFLNDPFGPARQVLMVPACSVVGNYHDTTCLISPGEHPFIEHDSYIAYQHCRIEPAPKLDQGVARNEFHDRGLMDQAVFARVLAGLYSSRRTKPFAVNFLNEVAGRRP